MKKVHVLTLISLVLCATFSFFSSRAFAQSNQYDIPELNMTIQLPESYEVCTLNNPDNEIMTSILGINGEQMRNLMQEDDLYLIALDVNSLTQINVKMVPSNENGDFRQYSDEEIISGMSEGLKQSETEEFHIMKSDEIHHVGEIKYLKIYGQAGANYGGQYVLQYTTLIDSKLFYISLHSHSGPISDSMESELKTIVESINYKNVSTPYNANNKSYDAGDTKSPWLGLLVGLIASFLLHLLPLLIYRYAMKGNMPTEPGKAKRIVIIDAVIVFIINVAIDVIVALNKGSTITYTNVVAIIIWSFIGYRILIKGYVPPTKDTIPEQNNVQKTEPSETEITQTIPGQPEELPKETASVSQATHVQPPISTKGYETAESGLESNRENNDHVIYKEKPTEKLYCRKCGAELLPDSLFCNHCGTKVIRLEKSSNPQSSTTGIVSKTASSQSDKPKQGFYFENEIELSLYAKYCTTGEETVYWLSGNNYLDTYQEGYTLFDQGHYAQAIDTLRKCLELNPIGISARFEISEAYLRMRDFDAAKSELLQMKDYLIDKKNIARFYRRMGYIEIELGEYQLSEACYLYSLRFEKHPNVQKELDYIHSISGSRIAENDAETLLLKAGLPILKNLI